MRGMTEIRSGGVPVVERSLGGHGRIRTAEWGFCRPLPYHLATWPGVRPQYISRTAGTGNARSGAPGGRERKTGFEPATLTLAR